MTTPGILVLILVAVLFSCNSPMQSKQERAEHDSANAPPQTSTETPDKSVKVDTTYGTYHIAVFTKDKSNMRDLILAIGSTKDTTKADSIIERDVKGQLSNVMIADLDGNGKPEVYCFLLSEGTGQYGRIYGFDLTGKVTRIDTYALDTLQMAGYGGQDTFYIKGRELVRSFPMYKEGSPDALTTDTRDIINYRLKKTNDTMRLIPVK
ncbi:hypothetical protein ACDQ55_19260 [Chitinophaga sp. 30R24]|uniref:hypothetical protein n=1 Tax=Chitinophaga sp. 30R24 TaxID=3248838 RepID=UPI003B9214E9